MLPDLTRVVLDEINTVITSGLSLQNEQAANVASRSAVICPQLAAHVDVLGQGRSEVFSGFDATTFVIF